MRLVDLLSLFVFFVFVLFFFCIKELFNSVSEVLVEIELLITITKKANSNEHMLLRNDTLSLSFQ